METARLLAYLGVLCAFVSAAILVPRLAQGLQRKLNSNQMQSRTLGERSGINSFIRNGVSWLKPLANKVFAYGPAQKCLQDALGILREKNIRSEKSSLGSVFCLAVIIAFVAGSFVGSSILFGVISGLGLIIGMLSFINHQKDLREEAIREAVPDALRSMSVCSHAGLSLQQSFEQVASELTGPLKLLFTHSANDLVTGKSVSDTLKQFQREASVGELGFVAVALDVQHKSGGSLRQVLDAARDSVESELTLKRNLRVQTAQAKLSARIVSLMPFVLLALFSFLSPGFLSPFFESVAGLAFFGLAVVMQLSGIILVRRLLNAGRD